MMPVLRPSAEELKEVHVKQIADEKLPEFLVEFSNLGNVDWTKSINCTTYDVKLWYVAITLLFASTNKVWEEYDVLFSHSVP